MKKSRVIKIMCFTYKCCDSLSYQILPEAFSLYIAHRVYENVITRPIFLFLKNNLLNKRRDIMT